MGCPYLGECDSFNEKYWCDLKEKNVDHNKYMTHCRNSYDYMDCPRWKEEKRRNPYEVLG